MRTIRLALVAMAVFGVCLRSPAATEGSIVEVFRALAMNAKDPAPPKDFYVNLGGHDGIKRGDLFEVSRDVLVMNMLAGTPEQSMKVVLGELRVVTVGEFDSVARLEKMRPLEETPALEPQSFAVGDQVRLKSGLPFR